VASIKITWFLIIEQLFFIIKNSGKDYWINIIIINWNYRSFNWKNINKVLILSFFTIIYSVLIQKILTTMFHLVNTLNYNSADYIEN